MTTNHKSKNILEQHHIKPSMQRLAVLDYLLEHRTHPNIDEIYKQLHFSMPTLSKTTLYNILKLFTSQGVVLSLFVDDKALRFDAYTHSHAHFYCEKCGRLFDLNIERMPEIVEKSTFKIRELQIYYKGICPECQH